MPSKKNAKINKQRTIYVKLASMNDLARLACHFSQHNKTIFASQLEHKNSIFVLGEHIEDTKIVYYINQEKYPAIISYTNGEARPEHISMLDTIDAVAKPDTYYLNVVEIDTKSFKPVSNLKVEDLGIIMVRKHEDLIKAIIKKSVERGEFEHAYVLERKGKHYIVSFDIFEDFLHGSTILYYSELKSKPTAKFARFDYTSNSVDFSDDFGERKYVYVKLIYLAQPFDFFKI